MSKTENFKAPSAMQGGLIEVLESFLEDKSRNIHTCIPAKVMEVNYTECHVTLQPLIKTVRDPISKEEMEYPLLYEVPILFGSAKRGKARMSFPVSEGDVGLVMFSERSVEEYLATNGISLSNSGNFVGVGLSGRLNTIGFLPEMFTRSAARKFSSDSVVLEWEDAILTLKRNGEIKAKNSNCSATIASSGDFTVSNGGSSVSASNGGDVTVNAASSINLTVGGSSISMTSSSVTINGVTFSTSGDVVTPTTITALTTTATSVVAAASMTVAGLEMGGHTHAAGTYVAGSGQTSQSVTGQSGEPS